MKDKFVLMNLDDENSKKVADVLSNPTCKRILNYLGDVKDASQKDISDGLNIPLNTLDYNMKKLIASGLVEKTKNFFWSTKGKKIPMYKLAKKHIIISPKDHKPDLNLLKTLLPIILAIGFVFIFLAMQNLSVETENELGIQTFDSKSDLKSFIKKNKVSQGGNIFDIAKSFAESVTMDSGASIPAASSYSTTNIQTQGVDEADIVKNDGKYIYTAMQNKITITEAFPAEEMKVLSSISLYGALEIFIQGDKLVVMHQSYNRASCGHLEECVYSNNNNFAKVNVYDISDKTKPELENTLGITGNYFDSRMIGDYVYLISNEYVNNDYDMPMVVENGKGIEILPTDVSYVPVKDYNYQFSNVLAFNIETGEFNSQTTLTGSTSTMYVSQNNIYLTQGFYGGWYNQDGDKTILNRISIDELKLEHEASGEVPGTLLNQFSLGEYEGNLRVATTSILDQEAQQPSNTFDRTLNQENNVYILDKNLDMIGKVEGLAPGERIYSVRFMGEKGYVVTFKKVDPLFVLDLSDAENPQVLGKLKIPGYSDYLHPLDENHIIGIGKDTVEADKGNFAWYQGVKMAVFDVTDPTNPIELHKEIIGDRGTQSEALQDHKAFLFDKEKELLVLPIQLYELEDEEASSNTRGSFTFQGAYVYNLNVEDGFELKGRISHVTEEEELKRGDYYGYNTNIRRSLYMDEVLYTISENRIKANDLGDIEEINVVEI